MPAGIKYDLKGQDVEKELYNVKSGYRLAGGFNINDEDIADGQYIPVLAPLSIDFKTRTAKVAKSVKAVENIDNTTLKVQKGSLVKKGMHLGTGSKGATITAIDTSNANYDTLTLSATITGVKTGEVLFEAKADTGKDVKNPANFLNYAHVKKEAGATVTALGQAYEIQTEKLYAPVSEQDKETLGARFMFI
ncbi:head fiber protein [Capnocytophaga sp. oral taxon 338]|uniref:head fiber protein n=1 Tax=Capnocytophaga sp. oral taxon 338 TaxID=710239 RepID=UPI000202D6D3|nr:head fiber protein [Capnocytophaga sp. oral taxon 338]EGD33347.1 hypothetical protein HMPREF9071_2141 [Capnocytophaga sp. oral taxon 338 str. F0234]